VEFFKSGSVGGAGSNACFYPEANHQQPCGLIFIEATASILFLQALSTGGGCLCGALYTSRDDL